MSNKGLDQILDMSAEMMTNFRQSGASSFAELFILKPDLYPQSVQDTYFGTIERFTKAFTRPNSYKMVQGFLRDTPVLANYLKQLPKMGKQDRIATIRQNQEVLDFLKDLNSGTISIDQVGGVAKSLLTTNVAQDILIAMSEFSMSFCRLIREVFPEFTIDSESDIQVTGIESEDGKIKAEWLIDQVLHILVYQFSVMINYAEHSSPETNPDLAKLN